MTERVLVINTGGTLTMERGATGYAPVPDVLRRLAATVPEEIAPTLPACDYEEWETLLDSSNIQPAHWVRLARRIAAAQDSHAGCVVLHGTDTMAYTASALAFQLEGISRPVILTGSQRPLGVRHSDAPRQWVDALRAAACSGLPEVAIAFDGRLLRGCRSTKIDAVGATAFATPRCPPLGVRDESDAPREWQLARECWLRPAPGQRFRLQPLEAQTVRIVFWAPGQGAELLDTLADSPCRAVILVLFGTGNGPHLDSSFMQALRRLERAGIVVIALSQCPYGHIVDSAYAAGKALLDAGVLHGRGMTIEASYTKMMVLASPFIAYSDLRKLSVKNLCGELD